MGLRKQQSIFAYNISNLIQFCFDNNIEITFGEAYRTKEQQEIYYKNGKSKTMKSNHLRRLAVDFNFFINGELTYDKHLLEKVGFFWESLNKNNRWGGNFKNFTDTPHFEMNL